MLSKEFSYFMLIMQEESMNTNHSSTYAPILVEYLLSVIALSNMYKINCRRETRQEALNWMPVIERLVSSLRSELENERFDE